MTDELRAIAPAETWPGRLLGMRWLRGVGVLVLSTGLATGIGLAASLQGKPGMGALYGACVGLCTYVGGLRVGLLGAVATVFLFSYLFVEPLYSLSAHGFSDLVIGVVYLGSVLGIAYLVRRLESATVRAERGAENLRRLTEATAPLTGALDVEEVAGRVVGQSIDALHADAGALHLFDPVSRGFSQLASAGWPAPQAVQFSTFSADANLPAADAARRGQPVFIGSRSEMANVFPHLAPVMEESGTQAWALIPLTGTRGLLGMLGLSFTSPQAFLREERTLFAAVGHQVSLALEGALLYRSVQEARAEAESLLRLADVALQPGSLDDLLQAVLDWVREAVAGDRAVVFLADEQRGQLVVRRALGLSEGEIAEVPWGRGIAGMVAASGQSRVVTDLSDAGAVNDYLAGGGSLVSVPLHATSAEVIGVLEVSSERTDAFDAADTTLLRLAAERISIAVERVQLHEREHTIAVTLQRSILPAELPRMQGIDLAARYVPASTSADVGGDWYDAFELSNGRLGAVVGDVVGKGILAAATMAQLRNAFRVYALELFKPSAVLGRLNGLIWETGLTYATVAYAVIDPVTLVCRYACAGHPPPLLVDEPGRTRYLEGGRALPIGADPQAAFRQEAMQLQAGDTLILYSDGLVERRTQSIDKGLARLAQAASAAMTSPDELLDHILDERTSREPFTDDVAILAIRCT